MKYGRYNQFEQFKLKLQTLAPVHIGSGQSFTKKEYIHDRKKKIILVPDLVKLTDYLYGKGLLSAFELYFEADARSDLGLFLKENNISEDEYSAFIVYSLDAGEAEKTDKFKDVHFFIKDAAGQPYIPGSSLKGAIRTALSAAMIEQKYDYPIQKLMRGIAISDSAPVSTGQLTLCGKYDRSTDGSITIIPLFRECLKPGTELNFLMTLDYTLLRDANVNKSFIETALRDFVVLHESVFKNTFKPLDLDYINSSMNKANLLLGGGAGFASKTVQYSLVKPREHAVIKVGEVLHRSFEKHKHRLDFQNFNVSPRMLKTTCYEGQYYQMGECHLEVIE